MKKRQSVMSRLPQRPSNTEQAPRSEGRQCERGAVWQCARAVSWQSVRQSFQDYEESHVAHMVYTIRAIR